MNTRLILLTCLFTALLALGNDAQAQGTAFSYQGRLTENGTPAQGVADLTFTLYNAVSGGATVGVSNVVNDLAVTNGLFTVTLDFGAAAFDGNGRWLQLAVRPGASAGAYTNLTPRQAITATPYAMRASSVAAGAVTSTALAPNAVTAATIADGTITSADLSTNLLDGTFWKLGGNAGSTPGPQFIGTTDNRPLEFKVNGQRGLRLEPTVDADTVNFIGGSAFNFAGPGAVGATIGGGGSGDYFGSARSNRVEARFGTVSGGLDNTIHIDAGFGTIAGGLQNAIRTNANVSTIGGGFLNTIQTNANYVTIGGGYGNTVYPFSGAATIGGGQNNNLQINALSATISGGYQNSIQPNAAYATIPGGTQNSATNYAFAAGRRAKANNTGAFVWADSTDADFTSTGDSQFLIRAAGGVGINKTTPASALDVSGTVTASSFSGNGAALTNLNAASLTGVLNPTQIPSTVALRGGGNAFTGNQTIAGNMSVSGSGAVGSSAVASGFDAIALGNGAEARGHYSMAAGTGARAVHQGSFVWADAIGIDLFSTGNNQFLIRASGGVGIGTANPQGNLHVYSASNPTVVRVQSTGTPGFGRLEFVSNPQDDVNEWRPGYIQSTDNGDFKGGLSFHVNGTGFDNRFGDIEAMRIVNGTVGIGTAAPVSALQVVGTVTATAFNPTSDRNAKENLAPVSPREVLDKVAALPISRWNFKGDAATWHVGPMAQDFHAAFGLGTDDKHIATVDADGVALAAIQGLNQKVEEKDARIGELERRLAALEALLKK